MPPGAPAQPTPAAPQVACAFQAPLWTEAQFAARAAEGSASAAATTTADIKRFDCRIHLSLASAHGDACTGRRGVPATRQLN
jgi:hypothetical protein